MAQLPNNWDINRIQGNSESLISRRSDDRNALLLASYGKFTLEIDGEPIGTARGDLIFIPAAAEARSVALPGVFHEMYVIWFSMESSLASGFPLPERWDRTRPAAYDLLLDRIKSMLGESKEGLPYSRLLGTGLLLEIVALWGRERSKGEAKAAGSRHIDKMKAFLQDHYREHVTKEELGECIGRTPNYAASLFRSGTGQTISGYVHSLRMKTAVYMLQESLLTVEEIAAYLGYAEVSYFQRVFKRSYGEPPSMYASRIR
ncbi:MULTISPECIES: helix-turn-helix transcriptional regulator [Paenibacillus]|uniref:helix-turn-helix transcriptional regulator n=1 Tax=Paenibacillus TaxID=44249 RepID=UPI00061E6A38|nr:MULTISPECIES: AraC family transcriptional regulator [Paenibacillus]KKC45939.1 hypothetical protein VE23_00520 [Paenibacillus sp. D9]